MGRRRRTDPRQRDGLLVLNKPSGPTSADCLNQIKKRLGQPRIGHAGTLDPLASGVLLVLLGRATKFAPYLTECDKTYAGSLRLGVATDTYDVQGKIVEEKDCSDLSPDVIERAVLAWNETIEQIVPAYSAAKHEGKPLYELARKGKEVPVKTKAVRIRDAAALAIEPPEVAFRATCSSGTYVRSLVHSLGMRLGCGATMTALTREASGSYTLEQAYDLDEVLENPDAFADKVLPMGEALPHWPNVVLGDAEARLVSNGGRIPVGTTFENAGPGTRALLLDGEGRPLALAEAGLEHGVLHWTVLRGI